MSTGPACILTSTKSQYKFVHHHPHPVPREDEVLIQVEAIGLNPIDWKSNVYGFAIYSFPWLNGRECAGRVIQLGSKVTSSRLSIGDRVFVASSNYRDNRTSTFQERCVALAENCGRIPENLSSEAAAGLGVAFIAAASALYDCLQIPHPKHLSRSNDAEEWILIWGAAATSGIVASQLAKASGLKVIGVASEKNFEYIKSRGVDIAVNREHPEEVISLARKHKARYAIDCVGLETSTHASHALADGGTLVTLVKSPKKMPPGTSVKEIAIKRFHEDRVWAEDMIDLSEKLLQEKRLLPPRLRLVESGMAGVSNGLHLLQTDQISGEKVVVNVHETPKETSKRPLSCPPASFSRPSTPTGVHEPHKRQRIVV